METTYFKSPIGVVKIVGDIDGVTEISVSDLKIDFTEIPDSLSKSVNQLREYFDGKRETFDFKTNQKGTAFQQKVWNELCSISLGKTISYLDLAKRLGDPKVIRAAAAASGKNKLWIVVPCHRVIGSDGSLTGYAGGLGRKKWLLEHEASRGLEGRDLFSLNSQ